MEHSKTMTANSPKGLTFLPIEWAAGTYCVLTLLLMAVLADRLVDPAGMLVMRVQWLAATLLAAGAATAVARLVPRSALLCHFGRSALQLGWLALWYPDTYEFNRSFSNLDHLFAAADQHLFGCQPSVVFSRLLPGALWSEAFNLGYWSYYPMILLLVVVLYGQTLRAGRRGAAASGDPLRPVAAILVSFFLYYLVYIFLPVAGPQFYFQAVGTDTVACGHFPSLGTYFSSHREMLPAPGYADGLFYRLVNAAQVSGERPTAAFPSSHIGISTILLLLARRHAPRLLPLLLPLWMLLCCATVYIQAHYLVDALAGLLSAPLVLWAASRLTRLHAAAPPRQSPH